MSVSTQLVFRSQQDEPFEVPPLAQERFAYCVHTLHAVPLAAAFIRLFGLPGAVKMFVKLATIRRETYCIVRGQQILNYGEVMFSHCRYYPVDRGAAVVGPVWTAPDCRGKGLATLGLKMAFNRLISRGITVHYIDTATTNDAMLRVISRCGFGEPIHSFQKLSG